MHRAEPFREILLMKGFNLLKAPSQRLVRDSGSMVNRSLPPLPSWIIWPATFAVRSVYRWLHRSAGSVRPGLLTSLSRWKTVLSLVLKVPGYHQSQTPSDAAYGQSFSLSRRKTI
jgi:hypothetical protein